MIDEDEISEVAFMDGFIEGYETAERELSGEVERLRGVLQKIAEWDLTGTAMAALGDKQDG